MITILDTNVVIHDPDVIFKLKGRVIVPVFVLFELDKFKKENSERGYSARKFTRTLDKLRDKGSVFGTYTSGGIELNDDVTLVVSTRPMDNSLSMDENILRLVNDVIGKHTDIRFLSRDCNLRVRADAMFGSSILVETYEKEEIYQLDGVYSGIEEIEVSNEDIMHFLNDGHLPLPDIEKEIFPNCGIILKDKDNELSTVMGVWNSDLDCVESFDIPKHIWNIIPRNREQQFALNLLLNPKIQLVTLSGQAGTGKSLISLAAGLQQTIDEPNVYHKLCVSRPIMPLGRDIGYLPGNLEEKLNPWMQPIYDNFEYIISKYQEITTQEWKHFLLSDLIQTEPLTYIRGRSLPFTYLLIDESQNLSIHEIKTIITRCGNSTKIVLTGDPEQIDNPYVDSTNNGLSVTIEKFKKEKIAGHVSLVKGERSILAETAAKLFK